MKLKVDALDPKSVKKALDLVDGWEVVEDAYVEVTLKEIVKRAADLAQKFFDSIKPPPWRRDNKVTVTWGYAMPEGYFIRAEGEEVCFIEFGTGVRAEPGPLLDNLESDLGFVIYPGSWSIEHEQTFQNWKEGGEHGEYEYNNFPENILLYTYQYIELCLRDIVNEEKMKRIAEWDLND